MSTIARGVHACERRPGSESRHGAGVRTTSRWHGSRTARPRNAADGDRESLGAGRASGGVPSTIAHVEDRLNALVTGIPFTYTFLDDSFDALYRQEQRLSRVFAIFAALAVVIACLGLFGLASYTASRRKKEIGIRKVLGASVAHLVQLLSSEFVRRVAIAFCITAPLAYLVMARWLEGFAYRTAIGPGIFAIAGGTALFVALATVSYHSIRAATADPVTSIRYE